MTNQIKEVLAKKYAEWVEENYGECETYSDFATHDGKMLHRLFESKKDGKMYISQSFISVSHESVSILSVNVFCLEKQKVFQILKADIKDISKDINPLTDKENLDDFTKDLLNENN